MENVNTKKKHPSLPSNFVTIDDLKQRWLQQKQHEKEEAEEKERQREREKEEAEERERQRFQDLQKQQQRVEPVAVVRTRSAPGIRNMKQMQHRPKIRTESGTSSRWIAVARDGNAELDNKGEEWKKTKKKVDNKEEESEKMKKKRNAKVVVKVKEIREESEFSEAKKSAIESGLNEIDKNVKRNPKVRVKVKETSEESEFSEAKKSAIEINVKQNPSVEEVKKKENEAIVESESSEAKKSTAETELNEEKKDDSIVDEVEEKFGGLSVNSRNGKQGGKIKRVNKGFGQSQPVRTNEYYFGGSHHGFSRRYGGHYGGQDRHNDKRNKVVWVKKGGKDNAGCGGGGEIEA
ncbi:unnamed protein product [Lupinus luteus]|uniref:Uncharacterized protein n=1 Tax=Lupinus luteus TaxID=3873 RepID=A0AAV1XNA5_LUPLU